MKGDYGSLVKAALRGARFGAGVGFALAFVTGSAFAVVTQDVSWFTALLGGGPTSETVIVWSEVALFTVGFGAAHSALSLALEIRRRQAIEKEFKALLGDQAPPAPPKKGFRLRRLFSRRKTSS